MPPSFLYFTSGISFRIPVSEDGTLGTPEILKRWTAPVKGSQGNVRKKKVVTLQSHNEGEVLL